MSKNCFARPYKKIENRLKKKSFVKVKRKETKRNSETEQQRLVEYKKRY